MSAAEETLPVYNLVTPEGVDLRLDLSSRTARAGALIVDLVVMLVILIGFSIVVIFAFSAAGGRGGEVMAITWILGAFLLRSFYFTVLEAGPRGATFGKRLVGIRVASADGRGLSAFSVFVRNIMKEIEVFVPISFIGAAMVKPGGVDAWITLSGLVWSAVFLLLPFFTPNRMRAGDIIGGTIVVNVPKLSLSADTAVGKEGEETALRFTDDELEAYGTSELQVLEDVLRKKQPETMKVVAERIRQKIGREVSAPEPDAMFLQAYYNALRQHLERRLLLGRRRRDKHDGQSVSQQN